MKAPARSLAALVALLLAGASCAAYPYVFADRITAPVTLAGHTLLGHAKKDLPPLLTHIANELAAQPITVELRGEKHTASLANFGIQLDIPATVSTLENLSARWPWQTATAAPQFTINDAVLLTYIEETFRSTIRPPQSASLAVSNNNDLRLIPAKPGEKVDGLSLTAAIRDSLSQAQRTPIPLQIISGPARVEDSEVEAARKLAQQLLAAGLILTFEDQTFAITGPTLRHVVEFVEQIDPQDPTNYILGVRLNPKRLRRYLASDVAAKIDQPAINARFTLSEVEASETEKRTAPKVTDFANPQEGRTVNINATAEQIARAVTLRQAEVPLVVDVEKPLISQDADIQALGITSLLARGESEFAGSPRNRIHNINVGASRYQGLLIPPGEEFSFNEHLGPITAAAGFKPELVIKGHATIPEFGGGLCQVSTTAFRAAVYSGLDITERKNHAYAVRYYGTPGFDATIYPGYTNLRFRNNTPAHILIQTKIEGTKLVFEFWGTSDGRAIEVEGPTPYNRQPSGAVKATLTQRVLKNGEVLFEKTFASNYRSPALYPKVLAANAPASPTQPTPTFTPSPVEGPSPP